MEKLRKYGLAVEFRSCPKNHFIPEWQQQYPIHIFSEQAGVLYFVVLSDQGVPAIEADTFSFHQQTLQELENQLAAVNQHVKDIEEYLTQIAPTAIEVFSEELKRLSTSYEYEDALCQAVSEADDHLRIISGYIPCSLESGLKDYLQKKQIIHFSEDAKVEDNPPIKLRNNWFSRLFEPISKMYMLPKYNEFDLTPFFAPFFMLFFGFCNADMVYGVIIILLALLLRRKAKDAAMKGIMSLLVIFGTAAIIMGWVMGSAFGFDLKEVSGIGEKIIIRNNEQIFNFAMLLGAVQILFAIAISIVKKIMQEGFKHSISIIGAFLFIATLSVLGASQLGADISAIQAYLKYPLYLGLALILLFNAPGKNPIVNIMGGIWLLYNVITGFFGDILSYIRLFALCVSSAILGFVINSIGVQMQGIPIVGPVIFIVFMLCGHSLNLALSALSGFVHPLRLTFVEFYKNAAFEGPGLEYKPLGKK